MHEHLTKFIPAMRFKHPCALLVAGSTGTGKSNFVKNIIECDGIEGDIKSIYYFMPRLEPIEVAPAQHQHLYLMEGLPSQDWVDDTFPVEKDSKSMIVIDDLWSACIENDVCEYLLTYGRRHLGVSLVFVAQNFYEKAKKAITYRYLQNIYQQYITFI